MRVSITKSVAHLFDLSFLSHNFQMLNDILKGSSQDFLAPYRLTVEKNEVCRIPQTSKDIQVLSGAAWLTIDGKDIILTSGEKASLAVAKDFAVISALGTIPAIVEVC